MQIKCNEVHSKSQIVNRRVCDRFVYYLDSLKYGVMVALGILVPSV